MYIRYAKYVTAGHATQGNVKTMLIVRERTSGKSETLHARLQYFGEFTGETKNILQETLVGTEIIESAVSYNLLRISATILSK